MNMYFKSKSNFLIYLRNNYSEDAIRAFAEIVNQDALNDYEVDLSLSISEVLRELKNVDQAILESALEDLDEYLNSIESDDDDCLSEEENDESPEDAADEFEEEENG